MVIDYNVGEVEYKTQKNYVEKQQNNSDAGRYEIPIGKSMTVPGEAMTIKEIMKRAMQGLAPATQQAPFMDIENPDYIPDNPIDLTDLDERARILRDQAEELEALYKKQMEEAAKKPEEIENPEQKVKETKKEDE